MEAEVRNVINSIDGDSFTPFSYLKMAHRLLENPIQEVFGREMIIRALNKRLLFGGYEKVLRGLVRKSGLYPYLDSEFVDKTADEDFLLGLYRSTYKDDFVLHSMQYKVLQLLMSGENVILSAPTSMGKSVIIDSLLASGKFSRVVLVVPTIALIDETRRRVASLFGRDYEVIHHGFQISKKSKTIYVLTQERVNERDDIENVDIPMCQASCHTT